MATDKDAAGADILERVYKVLESRRNGDPAASRSARLLAEGTPRIAQKVGEEAVEVVIEAVQKEKRALVSETADLMYYLLLLWVDAGLPLAELWAELARREGQPAGQAEKPWAS